MDDFEARLADGLARQTRNLPPFRGELGAVRRRGRNRRWASRGAGAVGVLAVLTAASLALSSIGRDPQVSLETGADGDGEGSLLGSPDPRPTPTQAPPVIIQPSFPTPQAVELPPGSDDPDDASLLVATGWGVGVLNRTGSLFAPAPLVCCDDDELRWFDQGSERDIEGERGAVTVRDDLRGGFVTASRNALYWLPAAYLADGLDPLVLDVVATTDEVAGLHLDDVAEIDSAVRVLYTVTTVADDGSDATVVLRSKVLDGAAASSPSRVLDTARSPNRDEERETWRSAAWLPDGGVVTLRARAGCAWIQTTGTARVVRSPYDRQLGDGGDCPHPSLTAMTVSDDGATLAISRSDPEGGPELAVIDLATGGEAMDPVALPDVDDGRGAWSEIDLVGTKALLSRGLGMTDDSWPDADESLVVDIETGDAAAIPYYGAPSFPRAAVSTAGLPALGPDSPLAFFTPGSLPEPDDPDPSEDPPATPRPDRTDGPPSPPRDRDREPVGLDANVVPAGAFAGTDGCAGPAGAGVCLGDSARSARAALTEAFGPERTDDPATFLEGDAHPAGVRVWLDGDRRVTLTLENRRVVAVSTSPDRPEGATSPFDEAITVGDLLATLGPPGAILQGSGEGVDAVVLDYRTEAGIVSYRYVQFWGQESKLAALGEPLTRIPLEYDALPVVAYRATLAD